MFESLSAAGLRLLSYAESLTAMVLLALAIVAIVLGVKALERLRRPKVKGYWVCTRCYAVVGAGQTYDCSYGPCPMEWSNLPGRPRLVGKPPVQRL